MRELFKIFSKAIATGREWKPCIKCGKVFACGEIISSITTDSGFNVTYWYCRSCTAGFFRKNEYIDENPFYVCHRLDRFADIVKFDNYDRYVLQGPITIKYLNEN